MRAMQGDLPDMDDNTPAPPYPTQWCLIGNIVAQRRYGPGGAELRPGTKHFSGGTKVWCFPPQWDWSYDNIVAIGRHRGSHRFMTAVVRTPSICDWRVQVVYQPNVLRHLNHGRYRNWRSEEQAREFLAWVVSKQAQQLAQE